MTPFDLFSDSKVIELVVAAERGDKEKINSLADSGVDVNAKGRYGVTPLTRSLQAGNQEGYLALLKRGANPNLLDANGYGPMNLACSEEDSFWLRHALAHGGDPDLENIGNKHFPGRTCLLEAIWASRSDNVRLLIAARANVNFENARNERPINIALNQSYEIVYLLVEAGAEYRFNSFDLVKRLNQDLKQGVWDAGPDGKKWCDKTIELLEKKGEKFVRTKAPM